MIVRLMENAYYCIDCKQRTKMVYDHSTGTAVCVECGLVLAAYSDHETSKRRIFANQTDHNNHVCNSPSSGPILMDGSIPTDFSEKNSKKRWTKIMGVTVCSDCGLTITTQSNHETSVQESSPNQNPNSNTDCKGLPSSSPRDVDISQPKGDLLPSSSSRKHIVTSSEQSFETIAKMCDSLKLGSTIRDRANENYRKIIGKRAAKGRKTKALFAACIDIACQQEGDKRTLKEICSIVDGITKRELVQAKRSIQKEYVEMGDKIEMKPVSAAYCVRRYSSNLDMTEQAIKAAEEAMEKSEELILRRNRQAVIGAVISMVTQLSPDKKLSVKDISCAVNVARDTIKLAYKEIYPYASRLIPTWFAKEKEIKNLTRFLPFYS